MWVDPSLGPFEWVERLNPNLICFTEDQIELTRDQPVHEAG